MDILAYIVDFVPNFYEEIGKICCVFLLIVFESLIFGIFFQENEKI